MRIVVELVPGGYEDMKRELARAHLANRSALADVSDYRIIAREGANPLADKPAWEAVGNVVGHDRNQTVWTLVEKAAAWAKAEAEKST